MDFVYLLLHESSSEWEDMVIILTEEDAIKESINRPNHRVEIFSKNRTTGYTPTYNYYKHGELIQKT